jgi:hypothetical protein
MGKSSLSKFKQVVYVFSAFLAVIFIHETGYFIACEVDGITIKSIEVGTPLFSLPVLNYPAGKTVIHVNHLPVWLSVQPGEDYKAEPWPNHSLENAAGVAANLLISIPLLFLVFKKRRWLIPAISCASLVVFSLVAFPKFAFPAVIIAITAIFFLKKCREGLLKLFVWGCATSEDFKKFLRCISIISLVSAFINSLPIPFASGGKETVSILKNFGGIETVAGTLTAVDTFIFISYLAIGTAGLIALLSCVCFIIKKERCG